jgi:hypothetical protein
MHASDEIGDDAFHQIEEEWIGSNWLDAGRGTSEGGLGDPPRSPARDPCRQVIHQTV